MTYERGAVLAGAAVVSLAVNLPGPLAARRLADLGAAVTKVEPPGGDALEDIAPDWYRDLTQGMSVRTLDLKETAGRAELDRLLTDADLLLTASRPSALARLGLSWERVHRDFPELSQVAITGGAGLEAEEPGHDLTYQAAAGLLVDAQLPRSLFVDLLGAERAAYEALAVIVATRGGPGSYREVALADAAHALAQPVLHGITSPGGPLSGILPQYRCYRTADGHIALAALEPQFSARVTELLGPPERWGRAFAARDNAYWTAWAAEADVPLCEVRTL